MWVSHGIARTNQLTNLAELWVANVIEGLLLTAFRGSDYHRHHQGCIPNDKQTGGAAYILDRWWIKSDYTLLRRSYMCTRLICSKILKHAHLVLSGGGKIRIKDLGWFNQ